MEFINNTGHIFSLPSYKEKPIGYEYEEFSYIFWFDSLNASKLSINNCYIKPIYALYDITGISNINDDLEIEIYFDKSNVFKLVSSIKLQDAINDAKDLHEYIKINNLEQDTSFISDKLTEDDIYAIKTSEKINDYNTFDYVLIPIYVLANASAEGTWISNMMIHITNKLSEEEEWCYISVGGEFVDEYEGLVINGTNMGVSLPKDILKAINKESIYNDEFNASLYNDKLKEYLLNYMGIRGEMGNFKSAINSLKWFGYGNKLSISKLLKTDNEFINQYLLDYFDISYDILNSFKKFKSDSLIALRLMTNSETGNWYEFNTNEFLFGENNPELESYFEKYVKLKIGNHDMPIDDDPEKYYYWKPYFDFSFNELGIKLALLTYYYDKYFLPIHLNIHSATLGYKVYANDIKMNMLANYGKAEPMIMLNDKDDEVEFSNNHLHYFTKQIHIVDDNYNEFDYDNETIDKIDLYEINDTCLSIPIKFKYNKFYNCILILKKVKDTKPLYEYVLNNKIMFNEKLSISSDSLTYDPNKLMFAYSIDADNISYSQYFNGYDQMNNALINSCKVSILDEICELNINTIKNFILETNEFSGTSYYELNDYIYVITDDIKRMILDENNINENDIYLSIVPKLISIKIRTNFKDIISINDYSYDKFIISNDIIIYKQSFSFIQDDDHIYKNFIIYPKHLNISLSKNGERYCSNIYEYWINKDFTINLLVNNKWYEYDFKTKMDMPILDFGVLNYRYYLNDNNYLLTRMMKNNSSTNVHSLFFQHADDTINWSNYDVNVINTMIDGYNVSQNKNLNAINDYLYRYVNTDLTFIRTLDLSNSDALYQYYNSNYNIISNFAQISQIDDKIYFNSYMHNKDLVISNNINFDISFIEILNWHIKNNLIYMDAALINDEFNKLITYNDVRILIHNDIIGHDFYVHNKLIQEYNVISIIKSEDKYIALCQINGNDNYKIITELLDNDSIHFIWDEDEQSYEINDQHIKYILEEKVWNSYIDTVALPKLNKYLNSIHMYGIYENHDEKHDVLVFHNDIDMTVNGLTFTHAKYRYDPNDKDVDNDSLRFYINGQTELDLIDSRYPDIYGLRWNEELLDESKYALSMYGIYVKCQYINEDNYAPLIINGHYEFTYDDFHYEETTDLVYIGNVIYDNMEAFQVNNIIKSDFNEEYKDSELFIEDDEYYFFNPVKYDLKDFSKHLKTKLLWKIKFIDNNGNEYDPSVEDVIHNEYKVKAEFYYYDIRLIRNTFVTFKVLNDLGYHIILPDDYQELASILKDGSLLWKNKPIQVNKGYAYYDQNGNEIKRQNPAVYWYNADTLKYEDIDNALNELKRYWFTEEDTTETIIEHFDKYIYEELTGNDDNRDALRYEYRNYLSKDLTGEEGDFELWWDSTLDDNQFNVCICIERYDGSIEIISEQHSKFVLYGNEKNVTVYFRLRCQSLTLNNAVIEPHIIKTIHNLKRIPYEPSNHTLNESIKVEFNGKEYEYGDNCDSNTLKLYKKFFKLTYHIWDVYTSENDSTIKHNRLYSIYEANDLVKLDYNKLDYDLYLMHDNEYWYCLYISKQTCETIYNENELIIPDDQKQFILPINETINYYVKYEKSSKEILLNRMEYISKNGKNHFNDDDIICGRILNNDRLPYNPYISAKWKISPMSLGMKIDSEFNSNAEMSVLSLPKNDNKYQKGYYNVTVKYSLDRDVQHQFKNTSTIKIL